jgi:uncharacterized membrane protein YphA (DoxX/SURF4 family)
LRSAAGLATGIYGVILLSRLDRVANDQFSYVSHIVLSLISITGGAFLILGLMTPLVSITLAACELIAAYIRLALVNPLNGSRFGWIALLLLASIALAVAFLGPGAYSIDALPFGRRRIIIPVSKK